MQAKVILTLLPLVLAIVISPKIFQCKNLHPLKECLFMLAKTEDFVKQKIGQNPKKNAFFKIFFPDGGKRPSFAEKSPQTQCLRTLLENCQLRILVTTPEPTVLPPSRIAKRSPSSIAMGVMSLTVMVVLSPGITISTPFCSSMEPVTSVVRK